MSKKIVILVLILAAFAVGVTVGPRLVGPSPGPAEETAAAEPEKEILYWVAPMDPNFKRDKPGKSPMGMDLVPVYADEAADGDAVTISAAVENNLGVRTEKAKVRPLWRRIEATGYVGFDETRISYISTTGAGLDFEPAGQFPKASRSQKGTCCLNSIPPNWLTLKRNTCRRYSAVKTAC